MFSVKAALQRISKKVHVKTSPYYQSGSVDGLILPGVGSFSSAQRVLNKSRNKILQDVKSGMPLLGICLGMQLMFERSEEGSGSGLGLFEGCVIRFSNDEKLKVPHMGWNRVNLTRSRGSNLKSVLGSDGWAYFAHSYYPKPDDDSIAVGVTKYGTSRFPSIIERSNVWGTQYHPEKSGEFGSKLISAFIDLVNSYYKK